jgi:hypothetical protein
MKKLLVALLVVLMLAGVAAVGVGYYVYRQVRSTVAGFAELGQVPAIERGVRQRGFTPPASAELTASQVDRFMRVQAQVRQRIGERFADFERQYKALLEKDEATLRDVPSVIAAYRDLAAVWIDAKRTQVDALNARGSRWRSIAGSATRPTRRSACRTSISISTRLMDAASGAGEAAAAQLRGALEAVGPETNRRLVESFRKQLEENVALASLGL